MLIDPQSHKAKQQISVAYKGLGQLHQFEQRGSANVSVNLENNPFPKPENYEDEITKVIVKVLAEPKTD